MAKFLGVISNSASTPSEDRVLEYTDLELLYNFLLSETQNLFSDFLQKVQFINDREIRIHENSSKFQQIYDFYQNLHKKTSQVEQETDEVGSCLSEMEKTIMHLENLPKDIAACKCTANADRNKALDLLVKLSESLHSIENKVEQVKEHENDMPIRDQCDLSQRLLPFLSLHTKILEQIEHKICGISELLNEVDQMFLNAHRRLVGAYYHKVNHGVRHSEC